MLERFAFTFYLDLGVAFVVLLSDLLVRGM